MDPALIATVPTLNEWGMAMMESSDLTEKPKRRVHFGASAVASCDSVHG
ncbi:MAG: hypothetical protein JRJ71_04705 [Deltaproteobacteria bacterium]|nr:hypothetical protein [Deltaproteobacteria bacterium]